VPYAFQLSPIIISQHRGDEKTAKTPKSPRNEIFNVRGCL